MKIAALILLLATSSHALTVDDYCRAILKAEGKWTYGIKSVPVKTQREAYLVCRRTVENAARSFRSGDFVEYLGSKYAPIGAENDPNGLNRNWVPNVRFWLTHK